MIGPVKKVLRSLIPKPEHALNILSIHKSRILFNLTVLQQLVPHHTIFPVLKSNAYGHGIKEISKILQQTSVPYICVDSYPEYQIVKTYAKKPVLIMGETHADTYRFYDPERATPVVYTLHTLQTLINSGKPWKIHLFLNTGMNREGFQLQDIPDVINLLQQAPHILVEGVMSHLANADEPDSSFNEIQVSRFKTMYTPIHKAFGSMVIYRHIANSAGSVKIDDPLFTAARSGIALYGYNPLHPDDTYYHLFTDLQPALDITSTVTALQHITAGDKVSYGGKREAKQATTLATIPFGYYEGLTRSLTNNWVYGRKNTFLPQVGRICMNISSCDSGPHEVTIGDIVTIVSSNKNDPNTIEAFAQRTGTISYEILVKLNEKIRRVIV